MEILTLLFFIFVCFDIFRTSLELHRRLIRPVHGTVVHRRPPRQSRRLICGHCSIRLSICRVNSNRCSSCRNRGGECIITWRACFPRSRCRRWCKCIRTRRIRRRFVRLFWACSRRFRAGEDEKEDYVWGRRWRAGSVCGHCVVTVCILGVWSWVNFILELHTLCRTAFANLGWRREGQEEEE